ncbi:MAG: hypothetical protein ACK4ZW_03230 [Blastomonas sp.]
MLYAMRLLTGTALLPARSDLMTEGTAAQALLLEIARPKIFFAVSLTPTGILAIGALTAGILLATSVLVKTSIRESRQIERR